ncbi:EXON-0 [Rachiplusia nu nucleopolyhedrovirus]|uniref:EXON-0 n=1 Tax=Rachiplusia nu nucleopolyhedrovirus TaxID=2605775 RepID=A0AAE6M5M1_9ABAC|nr:EXON-0 [Rachiplusia nu nucleopolyhedrovirus]QEI03579.1 EXON-0 [Rachiplusia nu nucleopolyhedrovirus]
MEIQKAVASILLNTPKRYTDEDFLSIGEDTLSKSHCNELETQVYTNFVLANSHIATDFALTPSSSYHVKQTAFNILNAAFKQTYNRSIDSLIVLSEENILSENVCLPTDRCLHYLIREIGKVIETIQHVNSLPQLQHNSYIFLPYIKQLQKTLVLFKNDLCCKKLTDKYTGQLSFLRDEAEKYIETIKLMNRRMDIINVFLDKPIFYCNICQESSLDKHFLKEDECCGYKFCNVCYVNLWKFASLYPVCPVCKTSFKSSSSSLNNKVQQQLQQQVTYED